MNGGVSTLRTDVALMVTLVRLPPMLQREDMAQGVYGELNKGIARMSAPIEKCGAWLFDDNDVDDSS